MEPGVVIGGRYRLVEPLASGGMGTVWRARHVELDVDVAVKLMSDALARTPTALARFQREAKAAAQLKSPHVVQVFDYGVDASLPYLAMELLEGEDLRTHLGRVGAMPLHRAAKVLDGLAKALRLAHAAGIVHRDLKPANVFLQGSGEDEVVKILDFGIAKELGPGTDALRTSSSTVVGSPLYMSPEQVRGAEVDHRTDVWSLAVIAFEMVTGRQPFEGASLGDVFARIIADDIPLATTVAPWLPPTIDAFFERALARPVARRFASAPELADAFRAATGDAPSREMIVAPRAAPRVAVDAPTLDASLPAEEPLPPPTTSVPAHTSGEPATSLDEVQLARTVATPTPSVLPTAVEPPTKRSRRAVGALIVLGALAATGVAVYAFRSSTNEAAPLDATAEVSAAPRSSPAALPAPAASSLEPEVRVEPTPSAATASVPASASAPATPSASSSAAPPPSHGLGGPISRGSPPPPTSPPPTRSAASPPPTTAIDPIFGVPVKKP